LKFGHFSTTGQLLEPCGSTGSRAGSQIGEHALQGVGLGRDPLVIQGVHGVTQSLQMPGKFLFENLQEITHEFAVIFDACQ
jgi:hypothetical protein